MSIVRFCLLALGIGAVLTCTPKGSEADGAAAAPTGGAIAAMKLNSTAFAHQGEIPKRYTCEGDDVSPPLSWAVLPAGAKSLALVVDDPDAPDPQNPKRTWVHWVLYDIPTSATGLPEAVAQLPAGTREGKNDWNRPGYGGPCPPIGRHRYFHKLYALDVVLADLNQPTKADLEKAMSGHVIGKAELVGTYQKQGK
ncbi:MAG: YbhB/YbcL family Raf kinase inhibitor-like protein [Deltaproteobacteria bacterium]|nr:YbhB/YbcL family Raf kinase inhibitor-like protein [Deltaproteobacteria bacterium]